MLPALTGFAAKALLPSKKKIDKDKLLNKKESSAIQKVEDSEDVSAAKPLAIRKKTLSTSLFLPTPEIKEPPKLEGNKGKNIKDAFKGIGETLQGIIDFFKSSNKNEESEIKQEEKNLKLDETRKREEQLEKKKQSKKPVKISLPGDKFNIGKYFGNILLGSIALAIFNNIQQIISFFNGVYTTIKDFIDKLGEFFSPVWNGFIWITNEGAKLIAKLLRVPPENLDDKDLLKNINEIKNKIPFLKNLFEGIERTINSIRSGAGQPTGPSNVPEGPSSYAPGVVPAEVAADAQFTQGVTEMAKKYNVPEDYLYAVMGFETGGTFSPSKKNMAGSGATGLIQFMPETAKGLGTTTEKLSKMTRVEQLKYVEKYFSSILNQGASLSDVYMSVLLPAAVGKPEDFVLFANDGSGAYGGERAYRQNKGLDVNNDGKITKAEATTKVARYLPKGFAKPPEGASPSLTQPTPSPAQPSTTTPSITPSPAQPSTTTPSITPSSQPPQIQPSITPDQRSGVSAISQYTEYERPNMKSTVVPIPIQTQNNPQIMGGKSSGFIPIGIGKRELLNSYYKAQITGFLYKQG